MIHDSKKYRQPTENEAAEMKRLMSIIDKAMRDDDKLAEQKATAALRKILSGMKNPA
jgi:hypothetical protein